MKNKRYSDAQIMGILKQAESGVPTNGWIRISLKRLRRPRNKPQTGSGYTTTTDPTWPSAALLSYPPP